MKPFSASEIDTARGCLRKWAFAYASDVPRPPPAASAAIGTELHAIQEAYLRDGTPPSAEGVGALARAGLPFLPPPGSGHVEARGTVEIDGVPFVYVLDWTGPANVLPGCEQLPPEVVGILDHKTSKDPRRYGLWSDDDMLSAPQPIIYRLAPGDRPVYQRWLYYPTQGRARPKPSDHRLPYRAAKDAFGRVVLPVVRSLEPWRGRKADPLSVPGNPGHCDAYGGCAYRAMGLCNISAGEHAAHMFNSNGGSDMASIWDNLSPNGAGAAPPPAAPPAASAAAPFAFTFGAGPSTAPAAKVEHINAPQVVAAPPAAAIVAEVVDTKPKRARRAAARVEVPAVAEHSYDETEVPSSGSDPLVRIGRALIAAGNVLVGGA